MAVISLSTYRQLKNNNDVLLAYKARLMQVDKLELLEEMVRYQEGRARIGHLTMDMAQQGIILFSLLTKAAETKELQLLTKSYLRHLQYELDVMKGKYPTDPVA